MTLKEALGRVVSRRDLTREEMAAIMGQMLAGEATAAQVGALAAALRMKGETEDEIARRGGGHAGLRDAKPSPGRGGAGHLRHGRRRGAHVQHLHGGGVRGRGRGATVAKHGNRAVSSRCGSADVLAALGRAHGRAHEQVSRDIDEHGVGFLFAPSHHSALRHVAQARREMGVRTASSTCWGR